MHKINYDITLLVSLTCIKASLSSPTRSLIFGLRGANIHGTQPVYVLSTQLLLGGHVVVRFS